MARKNKDKQDEFLYEQRRRMIASTGLYQRRIFIESLRKGEKFDAAMRNAGIKDKFVATLIYQRNSKTVTHRVLVAPEKVR